MISVEAGFADTYYKQSGWYEKYKLALRDSADKYTSKLMSINPYITLYRDNTGERLKPRDSHNNTTHTILYTETYT